jgi:hypothetical protein
MRADADDEQRPASRSGVDAAETSRLATAVRLLKL